MPFPDRARPRQSHPNLPALTLAILTLLTRPGPLSLVTRQLLQSVPLVTLQSNSDLS